ncbi:hypothetical protein MUY14_07875 [Amycolatopsis sp. FBCC-B4732]|nr:hypothetical protein [Amycolatopsis sp. FBCC-B4732]UOX93579.1 hypothetical protein MUY14_07875 [Amycolatopsis sp. FBCC-B4732]
MAWAAVANAPGAVIPSRSATRQATLGIRSNVVYVATITRSTSAAS